MSNNIPSEICREILLRLSAASLFPLRAVCKGWRDVIDNPCFVKAHTNKHQFSLNIIIRNSAGPPFHPLYYLDLEALNLSSGSQTVDVTPLNLNPGELSSLPVVSCNGLMLIVPVTREKGNRPGEDIVNWDPKGIWEIVNPITHERLGLPGLKFKSQVMCIGLGYDCFTDDYKVVAIEKRETHVFSLKSVSWKKIGSCPFDLTWKKRGSCGVFLNGVLNWVLSRDGIIVGFDVATEKYSQLALPGFEKRPPGSMQLDALSGCLFLSYVSIFFGTEYFDVWVMNDYGKEDSWTKLFSLKMGQTRPDPHNTYQYLRLVAYMKNKRGVLMQDDKGLALFDIENDSFKMVDIHGVCPYSSRVSAQTCVGSLFRLHCEPVVAAADKRRRKLKMSDTKLTLCARVSFRNSVRGYNRKRDHLVRIAVSHDHCYRLQAHASSSFNTDKAYTDKQLSGHTLFIRNSTGPPFHPLYSFDLEALNFTNELQVISVTPIDVTHSELSRLPALPVASCNGLLLITPKHRKEPLEIWNPFTHEQLELPRGKFSSNSSETAIGLGYDYATNDYKAVAIRSRRRGHRYAHRTHVYSLKSDLWRRIDENFPSAGDWNGPVGPGVFVCGALNWLTKAQGLDDKIVALDLGTEKYRLLQMPPLRERKHVTLPYKFLDVLDGCLFLTDFCIAFDEIGRQFDLWVMKDYGDADSWCKLISIGEEQLRMDDYLRPVAYMKDKMQVFLHDYRYRFFMFDVESNSIKRVFIHGLTGNIYAQIFPVSIFRLHDKCGVSGRRRIMTSTTSKMKVSADSELMFCVRDAKWYDDNPHDSCCSYLSSEDEDRSHDGCDSNC